MSILDYPTGVHADVDASIYHERILGLVSKGALDVFRQSPAHYFHWIHDTEDRRETPALAFGKALHCAILEPHVFAHTYAVAPDFGDLRTKAAKAIRDAWRTEHGGAIMVSADNDRIIRGIAASVRRHPFASRLLEGGDSEVTARWTDSETGLECKARADYHRADLRTIMDVKTTEDASEDAFRRTVARYSYHVQAALYTDGFASAGAPVDHFLFLAAEKTPPFECAVYTLDARDVAKGRARAREGILRMAECIGRDEWPGYAAGIRTISLKDWEG